MIVTHTYGTGYSATAPTEAQMFVRRDDYRPDGTRTPVVFCHSWGATAATGPLPTTGISKSVPAILEHLAACGWPVLATDQGGDTFGNDTGIARVEDARTYLQGTLGAKTGKQISVGWSEGGGLAMSHARAHPANVAALVLMEPLSDLNDIVTHNRLGAASAVNAAYSGAYNDTTDGPNHSPVKFAGQLAGIPTLIFYATDDAAVISSTVLTVIAGIGSSCTVGGVLTGGHGDGALSKIDPQQIARWLHDLSL